MTELAAVGWVESDPADGSDVAHLMLFPTPADEVSEYPGVLLESLALTLQMAPLQDGGRTPLTRLRFSWRSSQLTTFRPLLGLPQTPTVAAVSGAWLVIARAQRRLVVTFTTDSLSDPGRPGDHKRLIDRAAGTSWVGLAKVTKWG